MTTLINKSSNLNLRNSYRISVSHHPAHKKTHPKKLQASQTLNNSYVSSSEEKCHRSQGRSRPEKPPETTASMPTQCIVSPPKKDKLLLKMTSLYKFVSRKPTQGDNNGPELKFRSAVEEQIERDCLIYLQKSSLKNQHRSILHKKQRQASSDNCQSFKFQRSNTF